MSKTGKVNKLKQHISEAFLEIHPENASELNIQEDSLIEITSKQGNARVKAKLSDTIKKGVVFMPMHWGKILQNDLNRANNLTTKLIDPISKEPDFKFTAVNVLPYKKAKQKIVVIGAGAGACGFVKSFRALNIDDEIEIFSKENLPFYNRVMLPNYISGTQQWQQLVKMSDDEEAGFNIKLHRGVSIEKVDREQKILVDSNGETHNYDVLIIATGSRSAMLRDVPPLKGIFTMRSRVDADNFKKHIDTTKGRIVIVGGGLLGIELAASLKEMKLDVVLIHRTSRLMAAQLDALGSQLLYEDLNEKGIDVYFNDEIERYLGSDSISAIRLKSGLSLDCQAIVMAVGTIPKYRVGKNLRTRI